MLDEADLERFEKLDREATPDPWCLHADIPGLITAGPTGGWVAHCPHGSSEESRVQAWADARFLVAARVGLPQLIKEARYLHSLVRALRADKEEVLADLQRLSTENERLRQQGDQLEQRIADLTDLLTRLAEEGETRHARDDA